MTTAIEVRELPSQRLLVKKAVCAHKDIGSAFGRAIHSVGECLRASGATMMSAPAAVYLDWRNSDCDMAVGCKVEGDIALIQGCEWLEIAGSPHAVASHSGPYDTLHETHAALRNWCSDKGMKISGPCWESYPIDPGTEPDSSKWQTDVHYPVERQ